MLEQTKLFAESWNVAWRKKDPGTILTDDITPFNVVKNSFRYWAADPFIFEYNEEIFIFSELYDYIQRRGILGYYKISDKQNGKWIPIIEESYHMSYPCIIQSGEDIYIMPETNAGNVLCLYRAVEFPDKWEKFKILRNQVKYADTTPLIWNGKNMALSYQVDDPYHPKLFMVNFDQRGGDYPLNLSNVERRRSAGNVFRVGNKWIRSAQNCVEDYGKGLIFYEYEIDSDGNYDEKELIELFPEQLRFSKPLYLDGMHTYNCSEHYEVIDIKTRRFNLLNLFFRFIGKIIALFKR